MKHSSGTTKEITTLNTRQAERMLGMITGLARPKNGKAGEYSILRTLIDNIPDHIYVKDTQSRFILCNKAVAKRYGFENPDELLGMTDFDLFPQEIAAKFYSDEQRIMRTGQPQVNCEVPSYNKDDSVIHALITKAPLRDAFGNIVGLVGINRNITQQKQAQKTLELESNLLHTIMNSVPDVIYCKDTQSRFVRVNKAGTKSLGLSSPAEAIGKTDFDFLPKEKANICHAEEQKIIISGKPAISKQERGAGQNGKRQWTLNTKVPWRDSRGNIIGIVGVHRDITEQKKIQQKQSELLTQIEAANQELKDFAHIVSHDLKAPLRGISILAEWLKTDCADKFDEKDIQKIYLLRSRVNRIHNLIDGILWYSEIGFMKEETAAVDLVKLVPEIIDSLAPPQNITITIENNLPVINCDKTRITQVFQNLISNAIKFMDKPNGTISIGCVEENGCWKFSVADNGPGIRQKYSGKIFDMFQTLAPKRKFNSTGLGLTVVRKIVELYSGKVWVESQPGRGSTFFFTLPKKI